MCTNKRWITNKYNGHSYFVSCGHCKSCLQEKAINRTNRIRNTMHLKYEVLFVTLTYDNDFVPYIDENQLQNFLCNWSDHLLVYRDYDRKWHYNLNDDVYEYETKINEDKVIQRYDISIISAWDRDFCSKHDKFKYLRYRLPNGQVVCKRGKIGVSYLPDFQKFVKRLRFHLEEDGFNEKLLYFYCSEYGKFGRPHFHALFFIPRGSVQQVSKAVHKAWPYDNFQPNSEQYDKMCQKAFDASSYVSSYLSKFLKLPHFFKVAKPFASVHHYSHAFGISVNSFNLNNILAMSEKRDFTYTKSVVKNGVLTSVIVSVPAYVLHRYFPKFKGYSKLSAASLYNLANGLEDFSKYGCSNFCNIEKKDYHRYVVMLNNARKRFYANVDRIKFDKSFGWYYAHIWDAYFASRLKYLHSQVDRAEDYFEFYDNIEDFLSGDISHSLLDFCLLNSNKLYYETDPNKFKRNVEISSVFDEYFDKYAKERELAADVQGAHDYRLQ